MEPGASVPRYDDHKPQSSSALCLETAGKPFPLIGWEDNHLIFCTASPLLISCLPCHSPEANMYSLLSHCLKTAFPKGTVVAQWLRCCATNRKVAGSIPVGVIGIFH